ncbi:NAD(P)H-binding protein [Paenibacillus polygoni]|uniref:NAD(P)H-binding protein n=1 Tax=Paenibacillus polygoni TaxID=3050112 RepID=A0ABY8X952_9BACL|nr:NAD-dependent epimerase/dehydratase family protein [Paenibacillus polygoni]WIV20006.1 NAD(P)H-binding protein [Paenibacillus polygoni]
MLLITGITGHTGKFFLQELINNNYSGPIRCIVRESSDTSMLDKSELKIEKIYGDLEDSNFIEQSLIGISTVMHIYNIHHSPSIVEYAIKNKVERVILVHTTGIYSKFKYASEQYKIIEKQVLELTQNSNSLTKITILRPSMIYGDLCDKNMSKFIKIVDKLRIIPVINDGENLIQPVNARDLGKAFYTVLISPDQTIGKSYNLSGDKPIRMIDAFRLISEGLNKKVYFFSLPIGLGVFFARIIKIFTVGRVDYVEKVQRMGEDRAYSHDEAFSDFGYKPLSFKEGISIEIKEYTERVGKK